ncbi:MAG TPA: thioredoxin family protein [Methanosarcina sp.]|jgi:thiol-disulfide isomerase/thioredoxin
MKKLVVLLVLLAAVVFTAGCTEENQKNSTNLQENQDINGTVGATESEQNTTLPETQNESSVVKVTSLEQINTSLKQGPVLMKIGSKHCGSCQAMNPMLEELATEYSGKVTIVSIDITKSPDLATYFDIVAVPDTTLIMGIENGEYVYLQDEGKLTNDRLQARIIGQMEKDVYKKRIDLALLQEGKSTS